MATRPQVSGKPPRYLAAKTIRHDFNALVFILNEAVRERSMEANPALAVRRVKVPESIVVTLGPDALAKLGVGVLAPTLVRPVSLKLGLRWENQPFDPTIKPSSGVDGVASLRTDLIEDVPAADSSTEILFALKNDLSLGPRPQLVYNALVGHRSYLCDITLILDLTLP